MNRTTVNLRLSIRDRYRLHERTIRDGLIGAWMAAALLLIWTLLRPVEAPQPQPSVNFTEGKPAILVMTATPQPPAPTATPWPTPEPVVIEVPGPAQPAEPVYVYVETQPTLAPVEPTQDDGWRLGANPPPPPPEAPAQSGPGGSGVMVAPDFGPIPTQGAVNSDYLWCSGAAAAGGGARCVGR